MLSVSAPAGYVEVGKLTLDSYTLAAQNTPSLLAGHEYAFVADGAHQLAKNPTRLADAAGYQPTATTWAAGTHLHVTKDGVDVINWGTTHNANSQYTAKYTPGTDGPLSAFITDSYRYDNAGGIDLYAYERQYNINVGSELITTGESEQVLVTLTDANGSPLDLNTVLTPVPGSYDSSVISPDGSVQIVNGQGVLTIHGVGAGVSGLVLADPGGVRSKDAPQETRDPSVTIEGDVAIVTGSKRMLKVRYLNAKGQEQAYKEIKDVSVADADKENIKAANAQDIGADKVGLVVVTGLKPSAGATTVTVTVNGWKGTASVVVEKPIFRFSVNPLKLIKGNQDDVTVTVVNSKGEGQQWMVLGTTTANTEITAGGVWDKATNANGETQFTVKAVDVTANPALVKIQVLDPDGGQNVLYTTTDDEALKVNVVAQ